MTATTTPLDRDITDQELDAARAHLADLEQRLTAGEDIPAGELTDAQARIRRAELRTRGVDQAEAQQAARARARRIARARATLSDPDGAATTTGRTVLERLADARAALADLIDATDAHRAAINAPISAIAEDLEALPDDIEVHTGLSRAGQVVVDRSHPVRTVAIDGTRWTRIAPDTAAELVAEVLAEALQPLSGDMVDGMGDRLRRVAAGNRRPSTLIRAAVETAGA